METVQALVELFRTNSESIPEPLSLIFRWLLGIFLILALLVAIWNLVKQPLALLWPKVLQAGMSVLQGAASAIEDPVEHRLLKHMGYFGILVFSYLGFLIFIFFGIAFILLLAFANPPLSGWRPVLGAGFVALLFYFAAFFKAEAGRDQLAYRHWRNGG